MIPQSLAPSPLSLYIHIPFCKKKCAYCDFVSYAGKETLINAYVKALVKEIQSSPLSSSPSAENSFPSPSKMERGGTNRVSDGVRTVFFGGGTPTLLEAEHFDKIINNINSSFVIHNSTLELSIESNPGTADFEKLKALRDLGINRLSIGVQSFNDRHLQTLGRIHDSIHALKFYADARAAGFDNINLDLMFALPGQTFEEWKADLQQAIELGPDHLSTYNLHLEEGTPLWDSFHSPVPSPQYLAPDENIELEMYEYTIETLTAAGYKHYEISNFAKPGYECQHNINYWLNGNYLGIGAGAHSHVNGKRWSNSNSIEEYISGQRQSVLEQETGNGKQETIFLGLRLLDGIGKEKFAGFEKEVSGLISDGMLEEKNGNYRLTRKGLYLGNLVFEKFV